MLHNTIQGDMIATGLKIGVVVSRFNEFITGKLLEGCLDTLSRHGASREDIVVLWVTGAFEIPFAAAKLMELHKFDAIVCLGAVIRGSTPHFDYVCGEAAKGVGQLNQRNQIPVIFGVLTTGSIEQAIERAGTKAGNKGCDAALSAIEMANLSRAIDRFDSEAGMERRKTPAKSRITKKR